MNHPRLFSTALAILLYALPLFSVHVSAQTRPEQDPPPPPPRPVQEEQPDVIRVFTELVQTDVMVFKKDGSFLEDLRREDFELKIDGKPRQIEFFEQVSAGSVNEEKQLAAARGNTSAKGPGAKPLDRGRTIFFYIDDLHLDQSGATMTRKLVTQFIDREMGQNDQAAVTSSSGHIGFLQQLTDNRVVLRKALERLRPNATTSRDLGRPPMTDYQAFQISRHDRDTTEYFVDEVLRDLPLIGRPAATSMVQDRAHQIVTLNLNITRNTLAGLEGLVRSSAKLPGRKIVFFISNGFLIDNRNSDTQDRIQRVISAAARGGVVIYSMDARGLVASVTDASTDTAFDPSGRLERSGRGELFSTQDGMNALARDTGGRPFFNTNVLTPGLKRALNETSSYYLLAWKPDLVDAKTKSRFRKIEVSLINKPDLEVRVRRGYYDIEPPPLDAKNKKKPPASKSPQASLQEAVASAFPDRNLPVSLSLSHLSTPDKGELLSSSMLVPREFLSFGVDADPGKAAVDVAGAVFDDQGRVGARFNQRITVTADGTTMGDGSVLRNQDLVHSFPLYLTPGLYQVRVAARDVASGKIGSAQAWIEVPNLASGQLAISSLLIGEREAEKLSLSLAIAGEQPAAVHLNVGRRFNRDSFLRFVVFVYNATRSTDSKPDAAVQVQVLRDDQPVVTTALQKIESEGVLDLTRLPYAAEIPLASLGTGQYVLNVTVVDRLAKRSATQQTRFEVY